MKLIIEDDEGRKTVIPLVRDEISIGRQEGNTIRLTERNVSRRHARLLKRSGHVLIEDVGSSNGVRVNGERIEDQIPLFDGDRVQIGDYGLAVEGAPRPVSTEVNPRIRLDDAQLLDEEVTPAAAPIDAGKVIPPERMPHFMGLSGAVWGEEHPLSRTVMTFGRAPDANDLVIDHPSVSRTHGKLKFEGNTWRIYDLQSSQGIKVNGRPVTASVIQFGDTIEIGQTPFRFCAAGDAFKPPRTGLVSAAGDTQVIMRPQPKRGLYAGLVIGAIVLSAAAFAGWKMLGAGKQAAPVTVDNWCQKADAAITARNWGEAVTSLDTAKAMNTDCAFAIEPALRNAKLNLDAKNTLDHAEGLLQAGKFRQTLQALAKIPAESVYADGARAKISETKLAGVKQLSLDVQTAIDRDQLEEAARAITDLQSVDAEAPTLPFLQKQLAEKQKSEKKEEKKEEKTHDERILEARTSPKPQPSESPAPKVVKEEKKVEEKKPETTVSAADRDELAQTAIQEGIKLMSTGDMKAGIAKLQFAIAQKPRSELIALAHKNIGVGYAKSHQPEEAVSHLKIYLRLRPDAPDRATIEKLVEQVEKK